MWRAPPLAARRTARAQPVRAFTLALRPGDDADIELAKCDMAVLSIHSLVHSIVDIVANGTFDPMPTLSVDDLVEISGALNCAASSSIGWLVAALLLTRRTGVLCRPLERDARVASRTLVAAFALAAPISVACRAAAVALGSPDDGAAMAHALSQEVHDLPSRLAVLLGWRIFLAPALMF